MCTDENNDKKKTSYIPNCWKTAKPMTLKFWGFQFVFWKIQRNCMSGLFCIADLSKVGRKEFSFSFMGFNSVQA